MNIYCSRCKLIFCILFVMKAEMHFILRIEWTFRSGHFVYTSGILTRYTSYYVVYFRYRYNGIGLFLMRLWDVSVYVRVFSIAISARKKKCNRNVISYGRCKFYWYTILLCLIFKPDDWNMIWKMFSSRYLCGNDD